MVAADSNAALLKHEKLLLLIIDLLPLANKILRNRRRSYLAIQIHKQRPLRNREKRTLLDNKNIYEKGITINNNTIIIIILLYDNKNKICKTKLN